MDTDIANAPITVERFTTAVTFPTISTQDSAAFDPAPFTELHTWIEDAFPNLTRRLTREVLSPLQSSFQALTGPTTAFGRKTSFGLQNSSPSSSGTRNKRRRATQSPESFDESGTRTLPDAELTQKNGKLAIQLQPRHP